MKMISIIFVAVIVVLSSGCATSNYKQTTILPQNANGAFVKDGKQYVPVINQQKPVVQQQAVMEKQKCRPMTAQGTEISAPARKALGVPEFVDCPKGAAVQQQVVQPQQAASVAPVAAYTPPPPGYTDRYSPGTPAIGQQTYQDPRGRYMRGTNRAAYAAQYAAQSFLGNFAVMNSRGYYSFNNGGGGPSISMNGFPFAGPLGGFLFGRF